MPDQAFSTSALLGPLSALGLSIALIAACSSTTPPSGATCSQAGGAVTGPQDAHCGAKIQSTNQSACHPDPGVVDPRATKDAGVEAKLPAGVFNTEGDDDSCKYHVKWSSSPACQGADVTFTVTLTNKTDGSPVKGAPVLAEVFLDDTHVAPNTDQKSAEGTPGTYTVGPIRFDAAGTWTVRFHYFYECEDLLDDSPHGHTAFFVNVP